jgi:hypothetical protein
MGISLRKVVVVLAILTVAMTGATVYAYADSLRKPKTGLLLREPRSGLLISASEVDDVPSYATIITNPHPYVIEAVENPGQKIYVGTTPPEEVEAVYEQLLNRGPTYVEYDGKYYTILKLWVDLGLGPSIIQWEVLGFSALGACWIGVVYVYFRKTKRGTREEKG